MMISDTSIQLLKVADTLSITNGEFLGTVDM